MLKKVLLITLLACILGACGQQVNENSNNTSYEGKHEGIIVKIEKPDGEGNPYKGSYYMLVVSDVENINITDKSEEELITLAQESDGAIYIVNPDMYEDLDLDIGTQIVLYYNGQGDSDPPVREAGKIDVVH